jgi:hypothetical protein
MKYIKLFENFDTNFPDVFGDSLLRGVKIDKEEYIDDPKSRRVSTGASIDEEYVNFLKNYKNVGLQDPTQSVHFYLNPTKNQIDNLGWYGNSYKVIPESGAKFSFNIELRNGGLGSTYFFIERTLKDFTDLGDKDLDPNWLEIDGYSLMQKSESDKNILNNYQKFLIKNGVVGNLTWEELLELSKSGSKPMQIWTENPVLHKKIIKEPRTPRPYMNEPVLSREDFIKRGISPERIAEFWKSDIGQMVRKDNLGRIDALKKLDNWIRN